MKHPLEQKTAAEATWGMWGGGLKCILLVLYFVIDSVVVKTKTKMFTTLQLAEIQISLDVLPYSCTLNQGFPCYNNPPSTMGVNEW